MYHFLQKFIQQVIHGTNYERVFPYLEMIQNMLRIPWALEEAVALFDLYFKYEKVMPPPLEVLDTLNQVLNKRAVMLGMVVDSKFRNTSGLKLQLACVQYVVTDGHQGMKNASKLFYSTFNLYKYDRQKFDAILNEFNARYR